MTDLVPLDGFEITETRWQPAGPISFTEWQQAGDQLLRVGRAWQWWVGDWILYGEQAFEDRYAEAIELTGLEYQTISNVINVARRVEAKRRRPTLSWSHHAEVASLEPDEQDHWLSVAEQQDMTLQRLRVALREVRGSREVKPPPPELSTTPYEVTFRGLIHAEDMDDALDQVRALGNRLAQGGMDVTEKSFGEVR